jgi:serine/threonine protein kinase
MEDVGQLHAGSMFADYQIVRRLGAGGFGVVYLARHPHLNKYVALKILNNVRDNPQVREKFHNEADLYAQLDEHPNIVTVLDRGTTDGAMWIAMQYVAGVDCATAVRNGALKPKRAVRIIADVAAALDFAHHRGVVHRDVKPSNILLVTAPDGTERAVLTDFGIAKVREETQADPQTSAIMLSPECAAPEQFDGVAADRRTDVYGLGCTLFILLTGAAPYADAEGYFQIGYAHKYAAIPHPSQTPGVPEGFDIVISRAIAKIPADRYPSAFALAHAAEQGLGGTLPTRFLKHQHEPTNPPEPATPPEPITPPELVTPHDPAASPQPITSSGPIALPEPAKSQDSLGDRHDRAVAFGQWGDYAAAITKLERVVADRTRDLGVDHAETMDSREKLAYYRLQNADPKCAAEEFQQLAADRARVFGENDPATIIARYQSRMASGADGGAFLRQAMPSAKKYVVQRIRIVGGDHPDMLRLHAALATLCRIAKDYSGAVAESHAAVEVSVRQLGTAHPKTLGLRGDLAACRALSRDTAGAVSEFEDLVDDRTEIFGRNHTDTLRAREHLARWRAESGDNAGAVADFERLVADETKALGADHPATLAARHGLAFWRNEHGDHSVAVAEFERLVADRSRILGDDNLQTLLSRREFANALGLSGEPDKAVAQLDRLIEQFSKKWGARHPYTVATASYRDHWKAQMTAKGRR